MSNRTQMIFSWTVLGLIIAAPAPFLIPGCIATKAYIVEPGQTVRLAQDATVKVWLVDSKTHETVQTTATIRLGQYVSTDPTAPPVPKTAPIR